MTGEPAKRRFDTGTFVLLAVLGILAFWALRSCGHGPFFGHWWDWDLGDLFFPSWGFRFLGFGLLIQVVLAVWVGLDAGKRGMSGVLWGLLVFFTGIVGLLVYAIVCTAGTAGTRNGPAAGPAPPPAPATSPPGVEATGPTCRLCRSPVRPDFKVCPYCGNPIRQNCPSCGVEVEAAWKICPQCSADLGGEVQASE
jgi:hypothetical protein